MSADHRGHWPNGIAPRIRIERQATSMVKMKGPICDAEQALSRMHCTRPKGHKGDHVAGGMALIYARWADGQG